VECVYGRLQESEATGYLGRLFLHTVYFDKPLRRCDMMSRNDSMAICAALYADRRRRSGDESNGLVLHEYYFGNPKAGMPEPSSIRALQKALNGQFGTLDAFKDKNLASDGVCTQRLTDAARKNVREPHGCVRATSQEESHQRMARALSASAPGGAVMKALHVCTTASIVILLGLCLALQVPGSAYAGTTAGDRVLAGELVVTNAARNQFRLVDHRGSFTAPAGTALEALDGKPVQVEFGRDGHVLQISQTPIYIEPITHGYEVISGELVLRDPFARTFAIAGDDRTYVAPREVDIGQYAGRLVEMRLDEHGGVKNIKLIPRSVDVPVSRSLQECMVGGASVANGSSICRSGKTFRCADGKWVNLRTPCS
jgi:hypothetical protein